jgi:hypothetical protein
MSNSDSTFQFKTIKGVIFPTEARARRMTTFCGSVW